MTMKLKICSSCSIEKPYTDFYKQSASKDGLQSRCKVCSTKHKQIYYLKNRKHLLSYAKNYQSCNKEIVRERTKEWRRRNSKRLSSYSRGWEKEHKEHVKKRSANYWKKKYHNDVSFRIAHNLRCRLKSALQGASFSIKDLGCSIEFLIRHLESKFRPGMSWENYGKWHIDHIIPLSSFDLTDERQLKKACHYSNLQPLWAVDNLRKNKRVELENDNLGE